MATSNQTSKKRQRDDRIDFEYTGREAVPRDVTHVRFHSSVNEVGGYEYDDNWNLTEIPDEHGFKDCNKLKEVTFNNGLTKIGEAAFKKCSSLQSITLPSTLTEIGSYAFQNCSSLKEVVFNEGLKKIGAKAFEMCKSLQSITIPSTITDTGITVFAYCINLKQVLLKEGLKTINACAFYGCESLECITVPSTVDEISILAFSSCTNLRVVKLHGVVHKIERIAFSNCPLLEKFTFPRLSTCLDNIIKGGHYPAETKVDEIRGDLIQRRGSELFVTAATMGEGSNWDIIKDYFDRINELITYYEKKESTSLFELALWRANLDQASEMTSDVTREACRTRGKYRSTRGNYRIEVPGPVKDTILQYL